MNLIKTQGDELSSMEKKTNVMFVRHRLFEAIYYIRQTSRSLPLNLIHLYLLISLLMACSSRPKLSEAPTDIEMTGIVIRPDGPVLSAEDLFEEGVGAFQGQKFAICEERLTTYLKYFNDDVYTHSAHYNLGLCLEFQRKYFEATKQFQAFIDLSTEESDRLDGEVRLGYNLIFSKQVKQAVELYTRLLTTYPLKGFDRAECHLRRAMAKMSLRKYAEADRDLSSAMSHINGAIGPHRKGNEALAEVHFQRGEVYRRHMGEIDLRMPLSAIKRGISDKSRFLRKSLYAFVAAIKVNHTYWAIAAGHQLGVLYEDIYEDLMNAEYPADFDEETLAYYYFELDKKLAPLVRESISIYEKTITISATQGAANAWVESTEKNLKRLRVLEATLQTRLSLEPLEALQHKKNHPFVRGPITVPLPPSPIDIGETNDKTASDSTQSNIN